MASRVRRGVLGPKEAKKEQENVVASSAEEEKGWVALLATPRWLAAFVFVLSLVLYSNTLMHEFTFDDHAAVQRNPVVVRSVFCFVLSVVV